MASTIKGTDSNDLIIQSGVGKTVRLKNDTLDIDINKLAVNTLGTSTDNAVVRFDGTTGKVQNSGVIIDNNNNINITGTGARITGDFSNTTASNRVAFQSSTLNSHSSMAIIPNGTAVSSNYVVYNSSDMNNASNGYLYCDTYVVGLSTGKTGTGTYLPLAFLTANAERLKIDTAGNVLVTNSGGGLGYGTGAGGTVTQLTSKSTDVTLNKPTGQITTNNAALAAGASVSFLLNNSLITTTDSVNVTIIGTQIGQHYRIRAFTGGSGGSCAIYIENVTASSYSEAITIQFNIQKGANS